MGFPILAIFIIFVIFLSVRYSQTNKAIQEKEEKFWSREEEAEHTPAKDLSTLTYISVPINDFPFGEVDSEEAAIIEDSLREISEKKMLNLSGKTNTDLKLEYGTANFETMQEIGENFDSLLLLLCDYAKVLIEAGRYPDAITVLEFGGRIGSDISSNYTLLGDCYEFLNQPAKIEALIETVNNMGLLLGRSITKSLKENLARLNGEHETFETNSEEAGAAPAEEAAAESAEEPASDS